MGTLAFRWLANGTGGFATPYPALGTFGAGASAGGWASGNVYPRMAADVKGDGRADLVGFGDGSAYIANADGSFAAPVLDLTTFGAAAAGGWTSNTLYPRLFADVNGDGQGDILAFGGGRVFVAEALAPALIASSPGRAPGRTNGHRPGARSVRRSPDAWTQRDTTLCRRVPCQRRHHAHPHHDRPKPDPKRSR